MRLTTTATPRLWLPSFVLLATLASSPQVTSSTAEIKSPDLNLILQRLEDIQHQDPAQSRPYEVMREYKVLRGSNTQPTSEVMAQINFVPPDAKTYKIIQAKGDSRGERMVRELLDRETDSAKRVHSDEISRKNYDFVFLRPENFGIVPEYVLGIVPKRKDKYLLRGQIWVDASTPYPTNSRSTRQEPLLLDHDPSSHNAICATERYVGTRFLRRHRDDPLLGGVHTRWPQYPILRVPIHCAEIAMCDNVWIVGHSEVAVRKNRPVGTAGVSAPSLIQTQRLPNYEGKELRGLSPLRARHC